MSEIYPSDDLLDDLSGTTEDDQYEHVTKDADPHYLAWYKTAWQMLQRSVRELRVYKTGDLTFGITAGEFYDGDTLVSFDGAADIELDDDDTTYIWMTAEGYDYGTEGWPDETAEPYIPLATITTAGGTFDPDPKAGELVNYRLNNIFRLITAMSAANRNTLVGGGNADALHIHGLSGLPALVTSGLPMVTITPADDTDGTGSASIQVKDAAGVALADNFLLRVWLSATAKGPKKDYATLTITTGSKWQGVPEDQNIEIITDATGLGVIDIDNGGSACSDYVVVELGGRLYSAQLTITAT